MKSSGILLATHKISLRTYNNCRKLLTKKNLYSVYLVDLVKKTDMNRKSQIYFLWSDGTKGTPEIYWSSSQFSNR